MKKSVVFLHSDGRFSHAWSHMPGHIFCFSLSILSINSYSYSNRIMYHKYEKIHWAKHLRFQPYVVFCRNNFAVHWPLVFIAYLYLTIYGKTFTVLSKTPKTVKV